MFANLSDVKKASVMNDVPHALIFRNEVDAISARFLGAFRRGDARACSELYTEDAVLLFHRSPPIRGRVEIAAAFQVSIDAGTVINGLTTLHAEADSRIGYAIQSVHTNRGEGAVLVAMRCDEDGNWLVCSEAAPHA